MKIFYQQREYKKIKRLENSSLGSELKKKTSIAKKQYQRYDDTKELTTKDDKEKSIGKHNRSNLIYNRDFTFYKFNDINKCHKVFFELKFSCLIEFSNSLKTMRNHKALKENSKEIKNVLLNAASELCNDLLKKMFKLMQ